MILALALCSAAGFAALWLHARSSHAQQEDIVVIDLGADKNADVNMPYPIRILDHIKWDASIQEQFFKDGGRECVIRTFVCDGRG